MTDIRMTEQTATPHEILESPSDYRVAELHIDLGLNRLALRLRHRRDDEDVVLLFAEVHQLEIDKGYDGNYSGMSILDFSASGMEAARVRVSSTEQDPAIHFWARHVERIDWWPYAVGAVNLR